MILRSVQLDEDGEPERVSFDMSVAEAAAIGKVFGRYSPLKFGEEFPALPAVTSSSIYDGVCSFTNKFWEDGIDSAVLGQESDM